MGIFRKTNIQTIVQSATSEIGRGYLVDGKRYITHTGLHHKESALYSMTSWQKLLIILMVIFILLMLVTNFHTSLVALNAALATLYFTDLLFNLFLIYRSFSSSPEIRVSDTEISSQTNWPKYTVFCPLYKEAEIIPQFVEAMSRMDYPKDRLQVLLLLEEDDKATIQAAYNMNLPTYVEVVVIPHSLPKTKPKALNYGMGYATGDIIVIYDAEDIPEPLQLKKAVLAFAKSSENTVCIQAKLNFYNPYQNLLTKMFTSEYSLWFDLVLTGLQSIDAPIPLGGTSNHFLTKYIKVLRGWDPFNVTEDCDLGIRLVKKGYRTAILDSTTYEEANSDYINWFWQRTRWIKGYIQTYFVHMRDPKSLWAGIRNPHILTFQLVVGGKVLSMFINPLMWITTISYFVFKPLVGDTIESFFPAPVFYLSIFSLIFGNFLYMYYYMIGCAKRGYDELLIYTVLVPFYWLAMSFAAVVAVWRYIVAPHHWSKTKHGLHLRTTNSI